MGSEYFKCVVQSGGLTFDKVLSFSHPRDAKVSPEKHSAFINERKIRWGVYFKWVPHLKCCVIQQIML